MASGWLAGGRPSDRSCDDLGASALAQIAAMAGVTVETGMASDELVKAVVRSVLVVLCMLALMNLNYVLWQDYTGIALWAFVLSEALKSGREQYLGHMEALIHHELHTQGGGMVLWLLQMFNLHACARIWFKSFNLRQHQTSSHGEDSSRSTSPRAHTPHANDLHRTNSTPLMRHVESSSPGRRKPSLSPDRQLKAYRTDGFQILTMDFWRRLKSSTQHELRQAMLDTYDKNHDGAISIWELFTVTLQCVYSILAWIFQTAVDNGFVAFCAYATLHIVSSSVLFAALAFLFLLVILFVWSLRMVGFFLPLIRALTNREVYSIVAISGTIVYITFLVCAGAVGALYDLGTGSITVYTRISEASLLDDTAVADVYNKSVVLLEEGYVRLEENYASAEWWPIVTGVRHSILEGREGLSLLDETYKNMHQVYSDQEWWPVAEMLQTQLRGQGTAESNDLDFANLWTTAEKVMGNPVAVFRSIMEGVLNSSTSVVRLVTSTLSGFAMTGLSVATTTLSVLSEWGLVGFMFVFFLFKMTAMQTDVLEIAISHVLPAAENDQRAFAHNLRESFKAVFFLPFNLAFANALFLLLVFDMLEMYRSFVYSSPELVPVSCKYLQTCICFILSLTQVIGLWVNILTVLPWALGQLLIASEMARAGDVGGADKLKIWQV